MTTNCKNCGAPLQLSKNEKIVLCQFCGTSNPVFPELQIKFTERPKDPDEIKAKLDFYEEQEAVLKKIQAKFFHESNQLTEKIREARNFQRKLIASLIVFFVIYILLVFLVFTGSVEGEIALWASIPYIFFASALGNSTEHVQNSETKYLNHKNNHADEQKSIQEQLDKLAIEKERLLAPLPPDQASKESDSL